MLWTALAPCQPSLPTSPSLPDPELGEQLQALSWWALQFSPRVCVLEQAVLLELQASARLFGGPRALLVQLRAQAVHEQQVPAMASAPTALAALALLKVRQAGAPAVVGAGMGTAAHCAPADLQRVLDALPLAALAATEPHGITLQQLGCRSLGQLRQLPRGGISRRFGAALLDALDRAYGLKAESYPWVSLPEQFRQRLAFEGRIEVAEGMMFGVQRLLQQLHAWLAARQCGVTSVVLHWEHDLQRRSEAQAGSLAVHTAQATRDVPHLAKLLAEHLARQVLAAPVVAISLEACGVESLPVASSSLLPEDRKTGEPLQHLIERLSARLGPQQVLVGDLLADHRPQRMQGWRPAAQPVGGPPAQAGPLAPAPYAAQASHPPWLLHTPVRLAMKGDHPLYQGPLTLLGGPERIEAGWWEGGDLALRDYFIVHSAHAGLLWVYRQREAAAESGGEPASPDKPASPSKPGWYLHGLYG